MATGGFYTLNSNWISPLHCANIPNDPGTILHNVVDPSNPNAGIQPTVPANPADTTAVDPLDRPWSSIYVEVPSDSPGPVCVRVLGLHRGDSPAILPPGGRQTFRMGEEDIYRVDLKALNGAATACYGVCERGTRSY